VTGTRIWGAARPPDVRFGFVGAGWIAARAMAPAVHAADGAVLQAVAARDADRAMSLDPAGHAYGDYAALLADRDVDVVYVCLTNEAHRPWVLAALAAGKHVLCEKPLGLDVAEVREMHEAAEAAGRLLLEGYFYRWHPRMRRIADLVTSGALGAVRGLGAEFSFDGGAEADLAGNYRLDPARGGGALYDVGVYPVSVAHALLGPDLEVAAAEQVLGPTGVDLQTHAVLRVPHGSPTTPAATVDARCAIQDRERQHLVVDGQAGRVAVGEGEAFTNWHEPSTLLIRRPDGRVLEERFAPVDAYRLMIEAVAARVRGEDAWLVPAADSIAVATTLESIRGRAVTSTAE
jgi:predicted dehydrogenase